MAVYKVPQDVEAEDKLIGPSSFRQFIYLIVAALGIFVAWVLSQIFIALFIIPLPLVVAFLALALPLRKDQPMETYLVAMIKFYFKPRRRLWDPEGTLSMLQITAPPMSNGPELKGFGGDEASQRLAYLAQVVDTRGWASRGATSASDSLSDIFVAEASHAQDVFDDTSGVTQQFEQRITQTDDAHLQAVRQNMQNLISQPQHTPQQPQAPRVAPARQPQAQPVADTPPVAPVRIAYASSDDMNEEPTFGSPHYNPYPDAMHQHVVDPKGTHKTHSVAPGTTHSNVTAESLKAHATEPTGRISHHAAEEETDTRQNYVPTQVSPDILRLANTNDLSISALAHEAHRLEDENKEVVISLR